MGCVSTHHSGGSDTTAALVNFTPVSLDMWRKVQGYSFDSDSFKYVLEIQDLFVTTFG